MVNINDKPKPFLVILLVACLVGLIWFYYHIKSPSSPEPEVEPEVKVDTPQKEDEGDYSYIENDFIYVPDTQPNGDVLYRKLFKCPH